METSSCGEDLAYVHHVGFGDFAEGIAPNVLTLLREAGIHDRTTTSCFRLRGGPASGGGSCWDAERCLLQPIGRRAARPRLPTTCFTTIFDRATVSGRARHSPSFVQRNP
jgi:hypothetical protein